jgi:hypothetical protein
LPPDRVVRCAIRTFPMQMNARAGIALVVLGFSVFAAWKAWTATRNGTPVDVPIALRPGETITRDFRLNLDGLYLIEITAENVTATPKVPCLLGAVTAATACAGAPPVISASWVLLRDGHEIRRGNSSEPQSAPASTQNAVRVIGEFPGESHRTYQLLLSVSADGRSLDPAHPRLRVAVSSLAHTNFQSAGVLVFSISFICVLFGAILLGISLIPHGRE